MQHHRWLTLAGIATLAGLLLTGCNTFKGLGQDLQRGGEKVSQTAEETRKKL